MHSRAVSSAMILAILLARSASAQLPEARPSPLPDDRLKADILLVVAHPDDEILATGYLVRAILDQHKRLAVIYATRGDHGANQVGYEQAESLALEREMEARRAWAALGVLNVWFLDAPNVAVPTEDPLGSLEKWSHGSVLERTVRLIRLTRPDVVITWLPDYVVGENHSDHQAAGVLATEAFDLAGNPLVFPEQVTPPLDYRGYGNQMEGLHPWQAQKLYFFSDTSHADMLNGAGPVYTTTGVSPARGVPYYKLVTKEISAYLTQGEGVPAVEALKRGDLHQYITPAQLVFGKALVRSSVTGDVFEGVVPGPLPYTPNRGYQPESHSGITVELGSPWSFYRQFWKSHNLDRIAPLHTPEIGTKSGPVCTVSLLLRNDTDQAAEISLTVNLPAGWKDARGTARYPVRAHSVYPVVAEFSAQSATAGWNDLTWTAAVNGVKVSTVSLHVFHGVKGSDFEPVGIPGP